jgi:GT2 family glycosyltransferase
MKITVIIPTFNRAGSLMNALRSLQGQTYTHFEILIVDNAADAGVEHLVADFNVIASIPARYVPEPELGLHNARHAGTRAANGEILVFTDDDASFDPGWLQAYATAFAEHPEMAAAGGPVRPLWETSPPKWLLEFIGDAKMFPILSLMEPYEEFHLDSKGFFFGVNMAIRCTVLFEVGGFNPELIGGLTVGDGESGLNRKLWDRGYLVGYVPEALVYHHIPPTRMTLDYLSRWQAHLAGSQLYARYHTHMPGFFRLAIDAARTLLSFAEIRGVYALIKYSRRPTGRSAVCLKLQAALEYARFRYLLRLSCDWHFRQMVTRQNWLNLLHNTGKTES